MWIAIRRTVCLTVCLAASLTCAARAQEVAVETVLEGLTNPCGLAIHPETGVVYVADSGAGRVIRVVDGKAEDVIVGFGKDVYGKGPMYDIGPLGLLFLDNGKTLVVGGGDKPDGEEALRFFATPEAGQPAIKVEDATATFSLAAEGELKGEGNFYALATVENAIYATSNGDDTKGWIAKCELTDGKPTAFTRGIATKEAVEVDAPVGITVSPRAELVVGQMGEVNAPGDSQLSFYGAKDGKLLLNLPTGLHDIAGLAYSPRGQLYAIDFAWVDPAQGGLFQLIKTRTDGKQGCRTDKKATLDKPTAMAFGKDGALYITVIGTAADGAATPPGKLVKIAPGL